MKSWLSTLVVLIVMTTFTAQADAGPCGDDGCRIAPVRNLVGAVLERQPVRTAVKAVLEAKAALARIRRGESSQIPDPAGIIEAESEEVETKED